MSDAGSMRLTSAQALRPLPFTSDCPTPFDHGHRPRPFFIYISIIINIL